MSFLRNHVDINIKTVQTKNFNFCYCLFDLIDLSAEEIAAMYITEFSSITKCLNFTKKLLYIGACEIFQNSCSVGYP